MKNFIKISEGLDVTPILMALATREGLWNKNTLRTQHANLTHAEVSDIWLWFNEIDERNVNAVINEIAVVSYPGWFLLPQVRPIIFDLMHRVSCVQLGRVLITKLAPGGRILPHIDLGAPADFFERYQICLQGKQALFSVGDEAIEMQPGEAWWFNNQIEHAVINNGLDDRIVIIVDMRVA